MDSSPRLPFGKRVLFGSIPFAIFAGLLLAIEIVVRLLLPHVTSLAFLVRSPEQQAGFVDRKNVSIFEGDPLLFWKLKPGLVRAVWQNTVVTTNGLGIRREGEIGAKPAGGFRVLCLGDSVTFGYRVPHATGARSPMDLPYPALMESDLRAANPNRAIEVIPLAVPGYSTHQGLAWLRRDVARFQPDLVTACFGWNDIDLRTAPDGDTMSTRWSAVEARELVASSQALMHFALWSQGAPSAAPAERPAGTLVTRTTPQQYAANFIEMSRLARERGAGFAAIAPVFRDRESDPATAARIDVHRDSLRAAATGAAIPYVEIPELIESGWPGNGALFEEAIHPNAEGHRRMAGAILRALLAEHLLRDIRVGSLDSVDTSEPNR